MTGYRPPQVQDLGTLSEMTRDVTLNHKIGSSADLISISLDNPPVSPINVDVPITGVPVTSGSG
jgi:hypothetical protein